MTRAEAIGLARLAQEWAEPVRECAGAALESVVPPEYRSHTSAARVIAQACGAEGFLTNRAFALGVQGCLSGDVVAAVPVATVSVVWWAGAELLDDCADVAPEALAATWPGLTPLEMTTAAIQCITMVPAAAVSTAGWSRDIEDAAQRELTEASVAAAEGQLIDAAREEASLSWAAVMRAYVAKTGAAYGRDAALPAILAGGTDGDAVHGWRTFGKLTGVLRQVRNDNAEDAVLNEDDLQNGTPTLLVACALELADPLERAELLELREQAAHDDQARARLTAKLRASRVRQEYTGRLMAVHGSASGLLTTLAPPSPYRNGLQEFLDGSLVAALPQAPEMDQLAELRR